MQNKNKKTSIKILYAIVVVLIVAVLVFAFNRITSKEKPQTSGTTYSAPTEDEIQSGDDIKESLPDANDDANDKKANVSGDEKNQATVLITDAAQYDDIIEVRAFIPDHYEDGTCTITFTKESQSFSRETAAYRDATTTICTNPLIKNTNFPSLGSWQVKVSYVSASAEGTSQTQEVKVQ